MLSSLAASVSAALRPVGYLVRDLAPWLIRAAVGWLLERVGRDGRSDGVGGRQSLCRTCPFQPPGAAAPIEPPRSARLRPVAVKRPAIIPPAVLLSVVLAMSAFGCAPATPYVAADRATYVAIAPEYADYVAADDALDAGQKDRRLRTVESWRVRLEKAEAAAQP